MLVDAATVSSAPILTQSVTSSVACFNEIAKSKEGWEYLLVHPEFSVRTVDQEETKTKDSNWTFRALLTMITKQVQPKTAGVEKGTELPVEFKKLCKAEGMKNYSTMKETNAAIAERTVGFREIFHYCFLEDFWNITFSNWLSLSLPWARQPVVW